MTARIGLAGTGGIGSNVAMNLVRAGCDRLLLVDFDNIEKSNLNRQFFFHEQIGLPKAETLKGNLLRINPAADIEVIQTRLDETNMVSVFSNCPVVIEGFDGEADKKLLLEVFADSLHTVIAACGIAGTNIGDVSSRRLGSSYIVGDFATDCRGARLYAPKISVIAAMMADIAMKEVENMYYQES